MTIKRILILPLILAALGGLFAPVPAQAAKDPIFTGFLSSLAIKGYDPVAYFTQGQPVVGAAEHETEWMGATWRFSRSFSGLLLSTTGNAQLEYTGPSVLGAPVTTLCGTK